MIVCDSCGSAVRSWWRTVGHPGCSRVLKLDRIRSDRSFTLEVTRNG